MAKDSFAGDKKDGVSILHPYEVRFKEFLLPFVPQGIETYHLTMLTVVWSILVVLFSWLATYNRQWLWGASLMVVAQYISDLLDGAIGRQRNTGLVKWGFYMDHFLDYIFLCSILIGYSLLMPNSMKYLMFFIFTVIGAFMVNSFLQFAATNKFRIAYWGMGPTEGRIGFILINTLIIYVDRAVYVKSLPYILALATFALFFMAYNTQRQLWKIDMDAKAIAEGSNTTSSFDGQGLLIRYFLVSFTLASLAFLVLVAQIGGRFYKVLALLVYVTSWLPLVLAFVRYRQAGRKDHPHLQRFGPIVAAALIMICCAWAGLNLMPAVEDSSVYLTPEYRTQLATDAQHVLELQRRMTKVLDHPIFGGLLEPLQDDTQAAQAIKLLCDEFMRHQVQLSTIYERTKGYYLIDYLEDPGLHTETFLVGFAAQALQTYSVLVMTQQSQDQKIRQWLNAETAGAMRFDQL
ncbi:CDP-alcohol phosphatidyltransferase family protein, partial [Planctomycetota bacterium]